MRNLKLYLSSLAMASCFAVSAQTAIEAFNTTESTIVDSLTYEAKGAPESNLENKNYNYRFGNTKTNNWDYNKKRLNTVTTSTGLEYRFDAIPTSVHFRRVEANLSGTRDILFYYGRLNGNTIRLRAPYEANMETAFFSNSNILRGSDNLFANQIENSGGNNYNNIERVDIITDSPLTLEKANKQGFVVLERGNVGEHEPFVISIITEIDGEKNPTSYSDIIRITPADYGTVNPFEGSSFFVFRRDNEDEKLLVSGILDAQGIGGILFKFSDFGIADGATVYGYSIAAADFPESGTSNDLVNYTNSTFFPTNTAGSTQAGSLGGLDMMCMTGIFCLVETEIVNEYSGTLAFEDLWPAKGDYDFNDLVVDYHFNTTSNGFNRVEKVDATFIIKAFGASYENGFGFQLSDKIDAADLTVTGYELSENYITLNSNGTEAGQTKPTIIVFDNAYNQMPHPGMGIGVNTEEEAPYVTPDTLRLTITFPENKYSYNDLNIEGFNPFLIVNKDRSVEVHLPNYLPTDLANTSLFGTLSDASNPADNFYYMTDTRLPWALNICETFDYPLEKVEIIFAHLKFAEWAMSGGVIYPDWFKNLSGYRDNDKIYFPASK